jgi:Mn2+/Fe2+ NRAMP family transporter
MAIKPEEEPAAPAKAVAARSSRRRSELDLTKPNVGHVWRQYLRTMGPRLVTGASDDDPSGIATYSQAGARYGLAFLWTALLTLPLMTAVQEICDRTATGTGLGELAVRHFHRAGRVILAVLLGALIVANGLNIAADLVAIGPGMQLLHAGPTWLWALVAGTLITAMLVLGSFARIALAFKLLCAALLS